MECLSFVKQYFEAGPAPGKTAGGLRLHDGRAPLTVGFRGFPPSVVLWLEGELLPSFGGVVGRWRKGPPDLQVLSVEREADVGENQIASWLQPLGLAPGSSLADGWEPVAVLDALALRAARGVGTVLLVDPGERCRSSFLPALVRVLWMLSAERALAAGTLLLHAGAVLGARGAILLLGPSGSGKSTLVGNVPPERRLGEEGVFVRLRRGAAEVRASLWYGGGGGKTAWLPLAGCYVLRKDFALGLTPLPPIQVLRMLFPGQLHGCAWFGPAEWNTSFALAHRLCGAVPFVELAFPKDLDPTTLPPIG